MWRSLHLAGPWPGPEPGPWGETFTAPEKVSVKGNCRQRPSEPSLQPHVEHLPALAVGAACLCQTLFLALQESVPPCAWCSPLTPAPNSRSVHDLV